MRRELVVLLLALAGCGGPETPPGLRAVDAMALGKSEEAIEQAVKSDPRDALALNWRGKLRVDRLDFSGAFDDFSAAIAAKPDLAAAWYNRGNGAS